MTDNLWQDAREWDEQYPADTSNGAAIMARLALTEHESKDRWRHRAKSAQNELRDLRACLGTAGEWTPEDSIGVYRQRATDAEAECDDLRAAVAALADEYQAALDAGPSRSADERRAVEGVVRDLRALVIDPAAVLAARDAEVAAKALRERAEFIAATAGIGTAASAFAEGWYAALDYVLDDLRDHADQIEHEGGRNE